MRAAGAVPFPSFHPVVEAGFFLCAIGLGIFLASPPFAIVSLAAAMAAHRLTAGSGVWRAWAALAPLMLVVSLVNPFFLPLGDTVLFSYGADRAYTLEALIAGMSTAALLAAVLCWFSVFNRVMDSDKLLYLLGAAAPTLAMALVLVLRFVPSFGRRAQEVAQSRAGIGLGIGVDAGWRAQVREAAAVLSALAAWSLEHGVATADSMESRGYGTGRRTSVAARRLSPADGVALVVLGVLTACVMAQAAQGYADMALFPRMALPASLPSFLQALVCYAVLVFLPVFVDGGSRLQWHWSLSRP